MSRHNGSDFPFDKARNIHILILDVDGVMTDGSIIMDKYGDELKAFNVRDGHGIKLLQRAGIQVAIITGRNSAVVASRARDLGIEYVIQGCLDKTEGLAELLAGTGINADRCAMMGDDILDLPPIYQCALSLAPSDAHQSVLAYADWVSDFPGGRGAIRQAAEGLILAADAWTTVIEDRYRVSPSDCGWI
jgi:3-deoxy-D-manno-octulosonate 8-phosphate phosphatase (KDO 8-P phosphatase)